MQPLQYAIILMAVFKKYYGFVFLRSNQPS
jgi:hypothetical protein